MRFILNPENNKVYYDIISQVFNVCFNYNINKKQVDHEEKNPYKTHGIIINNILYSGIKPKISHVPKAKCQFD